MRTTTTAEQELLDLENRYWEAMKKQDASITTELTDFPCLVTGTHGPRLIERDEFVKMLQDPSRRITGAELSDVHVRLVRDDVAVVGYKVRETLELTGKQTRLEAADLSTWIRRDGEWRCAAHAETPFSS